MPAEAATQEDLAGSMRAHGLGGARLGVVAGSGLGALAERVEGARRVAFAQLAGLPASSVAGHAGAFVRGRLAGVEVLVQLGRAHLYEGHPPEVVARSMRACAALGVRGVLLTNAAGSLRREWGAGTLMRIVDHLNLQRATPLVRGEGGYGTPWDAPWGAHLDAAAARAGLALERGVYAGLVGPRYETPAEIALLSSLGAHAVGMSTVQEALAAHAAGMRVAGVSLLANLAAGLSDAPLAHEDVLAAGAEAAPRLARLLEVALPELDAALGA
jgi:inosine/guanosine/xanthosine phosphorylase family protein